MATGGTRDLTRGPITSGLWRFALPLMLGNLLQQCYNLADTWIVGRGIGESALAAVGSSYSLMTFLTSLIFGLCLGCSAFFSMAKGRGDGALLRRGAGLSFLLIGAAALMLTAAVSLLTEPIMKLLNIGGDVWADCGTYLRWVFLGIPAAFLYNYFANLLRGVGNSSVPLYFLALSVVLNILLDWLGVLMLGLGVAGAAQATVLSQYVSGIGLSLYVLRRERELLPHRNELCWDGGILRQLLSLSGFTCLQQSVMNFGILMIQGLVNSYGATVMAAFTVAVKVDTLAYMPVQDFGNAFSTFVAQNHGAGQERRIRQGVRSAALSVTAFCLAVSAAVFLLAPVLMGWFAGDALTEVIRVGTGYLRIEGACYLGIGILFMLYGFYRAVELPWMSLVLTVISLGTRVGLAYALSPALGLTVIWWAIPVGWLLADAAGIGYGLRLLRKRA